MVKWFNFGTFKKSFGNKNNKPFHQGPKYRSKGFFLFGGGGGEEIR